MVLRNKHISSLVDVSLVDISFGKPFFLKSYFLINLFLKGHFDQTLKILLDFETQEIFDFFVFFEKFEINPFLKSYFLINLFIKG